jgi:hypothetical protein
MVMGFFSYIVDSSSKAKGVTHVLASALEKLHRFWWNNWFDVFWHNCQG